MRPPKGHRTGAAPLICSPARVIIWVSFGGQCGAAMCDVCPLVRSTAGLVRRDAPLPIPPHQAQVLVIYVRGCLLPNPAPRPRAEGTGLSHREIQGFHHRCTRDHPHGNAIHNSLGNYDALSPFLPAMRIIRQERLLAVCWRWLPSSPEASEAPSIALCPALFSLDSQLRPRIASAKTPGAAHVRPERRPHPPVHPHHRPGQSASGYVQNLA